ncbi:hypothetical protein CRG98_000542 [Punica granatum]|uniref:Uncharacterized protein n=1 Tax=Punica granatum TaxID=22663 RepID=A0A2I0LEF8_PUNGR|nr:hypothetical protein CRG98_000542 [Punica granatum]
MNYDYRTSAQHPSYRPSPVYGNSFTPNGQGASAGRPTPSSQTAPLPPLSSSSIVSPSGRYSTKQFPV